MKQQGDFAYWCGAFAGIICVLITLIIIPGMTRLEAFLLALTFTNAFLFYLIINKFKK